MSSLTATDASNLFRSEPHDYIDVGTGQVAYRRAGTGPDVLFVHGWPVSGATFRCLLPHLTPHLTCHVIDLVGSGSSRFADDTQLSIHNHIEAVTKVMDWIDSTSIAVVGHDSGGMIARHAVGTHPKLRAMGLINTEPSTGVSWRFNSFISASRLPFFGAGLGWAAGKKRLRRNGFVLGDAFADRSLLDGEFDEFFLQPLHTDRRLRKAADRIVKSFDKDFVTQLDTIHRHIEVPVMLVWGDQDPFFPLAKAEAMLPSFPNASLTVLEGAGLFSHEEQPAEAAAALLPVLT
jgi:pimeloyl-ACP methyl ester carboxylesterase